MIRKLRRKIVCIVLGTCLMLLVIVLGTVFHTTKEALMHDPVSSFEWVLNDIRTGVYYGVPNGSPRPMAIFFQEPGGQLTLSSCKDMGNHTGQSIQALGETILTLNSDGFYLDESDGATYYYRNEVLEDGRTIVMLTNVSLNQQALDAFRKNAVIVSAVALAVMVLLAVLFARWVVRPIAQAQERQQSFFAAASHDLKTPLTIILANIALLLDSPDGDPQRDQYGSNIQSSAAQMKGLIQNMLDTLSFENMAATRTLPMDTQLNLSYLVQKSLFGFEALYFEADRSIRYELEPELYIRGNIGAMERLIGILLDNALKYSDIHTEVSVKLAALHQNALRLDIRSISHPISKEEREKIFQPFYRVDQARSDTGSYGLGLSIAQNIVTAHSGSIWVTTEEHANIFHITLPKVPAPKPPEESNSTKK